MPVRRTYPALASILIVLPLALAACGGTSASGEAEPPAIVEQIAGTDAYRITLSAKAAERLDIQTGAVEQIASGTVVPYSAVFYSPTGETWAYVSPAPLTFERKPIVVDHVDGDLAVLSEAPAVGTKVATVGIAELFGAESGIDGR